MFRSNDHTRTLTDDEDDLHDEDHIDDVDPLMDNLCPDDLLTPLERVEKYFQSEDMGDRDMANRIVPEALQSVENLGQFELLLEIAFALANDHGELQEMAGLSYNDHEMCTVSTHNCEGVNAGWSLICI